MATRTIHMDERGLFVKDNGVIWRPEVNNFYRSIIKDKKRSKYAVGDKVKVHGMYDMQYISVNDEHWYYHGSYSVVYELGRLVKKLKSTECWEG